MNASDKGSAPAETISQTQNASVPMGRLTTIGSMATSMDRRSHGGRVAVGAGVPRR